MRWTFLFGAAERLRPGFCWMEPPALLHAVLAEGETLISYAAIVSKRLTHAGETYTAFGLNGVFTYPDFRREGYGRLLVEAATRHIEQEREADIGVLFCRSELIPFYATAGWEHRSHAETWVGDLAHPRRVETDQETSERRMMRFISEKAKRARSLFWDRPVYFGESEW